MFTMVSRRPSVFCHKNLSLYHGKSDNTLHVHKYTEITRLPIMGYTSTQLLRLDLLTRKTLAMAFCQLAGSGRSFHLIRWKYIDGQNTRKVWYTIPFVYSSNGYFRSLGRSVPRLHRCVSLGYCVISKCFISWFRVNSLFALSDIFLIWHVAAYLRLWAPIWISPFGLLQKTASRANGSK